MASTGPVDKRRSSKITGAAADPDLPALDGPPAILASPGLRFIWRAASVSLWCCGPADDAPDPLEDDDTDTGEAFLEDEDWTGKSAGRHLLPAVAECQTLSTDSATKSKSCTLRAPPANGAPKKQSPAGPPTTILHSKSAFAFLKSFATTTRCDRNSLGCFSGDGTSCNDTYFPAMQKAAAS